MAVIHTGHQRGRQVLGFAMFRQLQFPVPHPSKCSCFVFYRSCLLRPDILHTPWSSRPGTVFLLESWQLLNDLPRSRTHTVLGCRVVDFRRCFFQRIRCSEGEVLQNWTVHILRRRRIQWCFDVHWNKFSTADLRADTGSCCRCHQRCNAALLRILQQ